jgi:ATP-dependent Lon protease
MITYWNEKDKANGGSGGSGGGDARQLVQELAALDAQIQTMVTSVKSTLDKAVYGHDRPKRQIMKILSQWMTGEPQGYCLGFEGPPGLGKTTLAKYGLAKCLVDAQGNPRPFHLIAMGGSTHGSTLEGHEYTYAHSQWGKICDILMDSKCMNPIIYIDELDKISKSEYGKEIIGILTHVVDPTQNSGFQDKYFNGISLDLSKVLFVFSYNHPENIDSILLDRIHRVEFQGFNVHEKVVILKDYIMPEIMCNMGLQNSVEFESEETIQYLVETYTNEPGLRKIKEIVFDILAEINMECVGMIKNENMDIMLPFKITETWIDKKLHHYKKNRCMVATQDNDSSKCGQVHGLWANSLGQGGVIPVETSWFPAQTFLELKLTGLPGNVMQESMNVAKTVAWNMTPPSIQQQILLSKNAQGIHIHCPDGATSKEGPSAGAAIALALYSLWNHVQIPTTVAITGELTLQGRITAIGGLEAKITGGIKAGIRRFIIPKANHEDWLEIVRKEHPQVSEIVVTEVNNIQELLDMML